MIELLTYQTKSSSSSRPSSNDVKPLNPIPIPIPIIPIPIPSLYLHRRRSLSTPHSFLCYKPNPPSPSSHVITARQRYHVNENNYVQHLKRREQEEEKMEKYFGNAYRGDPGIPHSDGDRFGNIWIGAITFSALTWFDPYMWHLTNQFNWHDKAMLYKQYHWKKAMKKKEPYKFKWNEYMDKEARDSYYFNWPVYFP